MENRDKDFLHKGITEKIIGAAFTVHKQLGQGFAEKVYENALVKELKTAGLKVEQQKSMKVLYGGEGVGDFIADLLVEDVVMVELKAVRVMDKSFENQLLNYMRTSGIEVGLLLNFGPSVQIKRKIFTKTSA